MKSFIQQYTPRIDNCGVYWWIIDFLMKEITQIERNYTKRMQWRKFLSNMKSFRLFIASAKFLDLIIIICQKTFSVLENWPNLSLNFPWILNQGQDFIIKESRIQGVTNIPEYFYGDGSPLFLRRCQTTRTPQNFTKNCIFMPQLLADNVKKAPGDLKRGPGDVKP